MDPENIDPKPTEEEYANTLLREELVVTREPKGRGKISPVSPLAGAVLQSNRVLFKRVYDAYKQYGGHWMRHQVLMSLLVFESMEDRFQGFRCHQEVSREVQTVTFISPTVDYSNIYLLNVTAGCSKGCGCIWSSTLNSSAMYALCR